MGIDNIDDLFKQMQLDELEDGAAATSKLTPIDYARLRGIAPQKVYYVLRNHKDKLKIERCNCGRKVIDVKEADKYFGFEKDRDGSEQDDTAGNLPGPTSESTVS